MFKTASYTYVKGTTWVREILWQIFHDGATSNVHIGDRVYWFDMHPLLRRRGAEKDQSSPSPRQIVELLPSPRLFHSHLPYHLIPKGQDERTVCKYIYIARNPKDVVVSFYLFMQTIPEMPENGMTIDQVIEGFLNGSGEYRGAFRPEVSRIKLREGTFFLGGGGLGPQRGGSSVKMSTKRGGPYRV